MKKVLQIFNLNDPGWGRKSDEPKDNAKDAKPNDSYNPNHAEDEFDFQRKNDKDAKPIDELDKVWRDFNERLKNFADMNKKSGGNGSNGGAGSGKSKGFFPQFSVMAIIALLVWLATGFYTIKEGQVGVVTRFGEYIKTVGPGFHWNFPEPIESRTQVDVSKVRSFSVGFSDNSRQKILPEALMLTEDENIVDLQFTVQYRLKIGQINDTSGSLTPAANYLYSLVNPDVSVRQAAETAMREIVGKQSMNKILYESRTTAANDVMKLIQNILDSYNSGIEITTVAIQNVQPPEQVQAAFDDAIKAGQDNERQKNEAYAYSSKVIPEAQGRASRLLEDAEGYKAHVMGLANGEASRFNSVVSAYVSNPSITKERLYLDTMQQVLAQSSKVLLGNGNGNGSNITILPLDQLVKNDSSLARTSGTSSESSNYQPVASSDTAKAVGANAAAIQSVQREQLLRDRQLNRRGQ